MKPTKRLISTTVFFFILCVSCQNKPVDANSFQTGLAKCKEQRKENPYSGPACLEGYKMADFSSVTISGDSLSTKDLIGKPSVVNLWFIGCKPCEAEIPGLNSVATRYKDKANFVAIGRNSNDYFQEFMEGKEWNFQHINDPDEKLLNGDLKHMWGYPTTYVLDQKGIIVKAFSGGRVDSLATQYIIDKIEPTLEELLN